MSIERRTPTAMPTRSRSWENLVPHVDLGRGVQARHIQVDMGRAPTFDLYAKAGGVLKTMQAELGRYDAAKWTSMTKPLGELRNEVMHPVTTLVGSVDDMIRLTRDIQNAIELVERAIIALRKKYPAPK